MHLTLTRKNKTQYAIDGQITIDGEHICDTAECITAALPVGTYRVALIRCHQHGRKMPVIIPMSEAASALRGADTHITPLLAARPKCASCKKLKCVSNNTPMPRYCPMIKPGNGVCNRQDGSIIVGERCVSGCLLHPVTHFNRLYERIRKSASRGHDITLTIV